MLTIEKFKARLVRANHPDWLHVGVDSLDESQLYILVNGGLGNINCAPIELYAQEIKDCVLTMVAQGNLYIKQGEKSLRIGQGRRIYCYTIKVDKDPAQTESIVPKMYFSSTFLSWQITHDLSDEQAQEKLGLTENEFHKFREDELTISQDLINKLSAVTGFSPEFWYKRWCQQQKRNIKHSDNRESQ